MDDLYEGTYKKNNLIFMTWGRKLSLSINNLNPRPCLNRQFRLERGVVEISM